MRLALFVLLAGRVVAIPSVHADDREQVTLLAFEGPGSTIRRPVLDRASRRRVERELDRALAASPSRPSEDEIPVQATRP
jgi:hypothetical protein